MSYFTEQERSKSVSFTLDSKGEPRIRRQAFTAAQRMNIAICRKWTCEKCGKKNLHDTLGWDVDHIQEIADGGTDALENLQLLCSSCHADKTRVNQMVRAADKRKRSATIDDEDGVVDQIRKETKRYRALEDKLHQAIQSAKKKHDKKMEILLAAQKCVAGNSHRASEEKNKEGDLGKEDESKCEIEDPPVPCKRKIKKDPLYGALQFLRELKGRLALCGTDFRELMWFTGGVWKKFTQKDFTEYVDETIERRMTFRDLKYNEVLRATRTRDAIDIIPENMRSDVLKELAGDPPAQQPAVANSHNAGSKCSHQPNS